MIVFGESGVGKTSIVNMLAGKEIFPVGRAAVGTTLESHGCLIKCEGLSLNVYDTVGLNEPPTGSVSAKEAIRALYNLKRDLATGCGINLLVFVTTFRIRKQTVDSFNLLCAVFGEQRVPTVIAITNQEYVDNRRWWKENRSLFVKSGMTFEGYAIGTADSKLAHEQTYLEMQEGLQRAIREHGKVAGVTLPQRSWFEGAVTRMFRKFRGLYDISKSEVSRLVREVLIEHGCDEEDATRSAKRVKKGL
jgi:hypothetical protein